MKLKGFVFFTIFAAVLMGLNYISKNMDCFKLAEGEITLLVHNKNLVQIGDIRKNVADIKYYNTEEPAQLNDYASLICLGKEVRLYRGIFNENELRSMWFINAGIWAFMTLIVAGVLLEAVSRQLLLPIEIDE